MTRILKSLQLTPELQTYIAEAGVREHPALAKCREETDALGGISVMQIGPEQGAFMGLLAAATGTRKVLEVGVFTGYSSLALALAMGPEGRITACDISEEFVAHARRHWEAGGVSDRIETRIGPAGDTLSDLLGEGMAGHFDMAFIDADKTGYDGYYEAALKLVRKGGLILIDNTLWFGAVADPEADDHDTMALKALNAKIHDDERVDMVITPIGDGLTLCLSALALRLTRG